MTTRTNGTLVECSIPAESLSAGRCDLVAGGVEVTVIRDGDRVFAIRNQCPHQNGRLGDGVVEGGTITCPLHRWRFDLATGRTKRDRHLAAEVFPVRREGDRYVVAVTSRRVDPGAGNDVRPGRPGEAVPPDRGPRESP